VESWQFAPVSSIANGMPRPSQIKWCLLPRLARSVGSAPVCGPKTARTEQLSTTAWDQSTYSEQDLESVTLIKKMQRFGFKLVEIRRVLQLWILPSDSGRASPYQRGSHECLREALNLGEKKLQTMNDEIRSAIQIRDELMEALGQIRASLNAPTRQKTPSDHAESSRPTAVS
jgi:DNA-binding transcriptional MerR regulator